MDFNRESKNFQKVFAVSLAPLDWKTGEVSAKIIEIEAGFLMLETPIRIWVTPKEGILRKKGMPFPMEVPAKFVFDGASIPKPLRPLLGKKTDKQFRIAAAFHDFLYSKTEIDRTFADEIFYMLLRLNGVGVVKATTFFLGVRSFGWMFKF